MRLLTYFASPRDLSLYCYSTVELMISLVPAISDRRLRALALLLSFPRVYIILNLYYPSVSDYLTCRQFRVLIIVKVTKFL
jgi:hypothetical protein